MNGMPRPTVQPVPPHGLNSYIYAARPSLCEHLFRP
jgi:hypothetical protein